MKRKKETVKGAALGAALTGVTLGLGGCAVMRPQTVYGPPPEETVPAVQEETTFDPADMPVEDVYGPPVFEEEPVEESE